MFPEGFTADAAPGLLEDTVVERAASLSSNYVGFFTDTPPFDDVRVRRAFAHALDRARIVSDLGGQGEPATTGGLVPPAIPGHSHRIGLDFDPTRANELLGDAGFPGGRGLRPIVLAAHAVVAEELVAAQWREHLNAVVTVVPMPGVDPREIDPRPACWTHGWTADIPDAAGFSVAMLTGSPGRDFLHHDTTTDAVLQRLVAARRRDERLELARELERVWLSDQVAMVPLRYGTEIWLRRPSVEGFWTSPLMPGSLSDIVIRR